MTMTLQEQYQETKEEAIALLKEGKQTLALELIRELRDCIAICENSKTDVGLLWEFAETGMNDETLVDDPEAPILERLRKINPDFVPKGKSNGLSFTGKFNRWLNKGKTPQTEERS